MLGLRLDVNMDMDVDMDVDIGKHHHIDSHNYKLVHHDSDSMPSQSISYSNPVQSHSFDFRFGGERSTTYL